MHSIYKTSEEQYVEITELWEQSVRETHHFLTEKDIAFFKPLVLHNFLKTVDLYCIHDADGLAGFLGVSGEKIEMLFVHPRAFGKGIGKRLLTFALDQLGATSVDVNEQNEKAVGFYKHHGFGIQSRSPLDTMGKPFPILHMKMVR